ncbi:hypothetical protein KCU65_g5558, partial [Aureobasidium melanogenum]
MSTTVPCPEKSIASAELMTDPEKPASDLELGTPEPTTSTRAIRGIKAIVSVLFSMFMYSLDGTIVADLVPSIVNEFDSVPLLPWLSVGFMVGSIVTVAYMMLAQFTGIFMGLSIGDAIFINEALKSLKALLPMLPEAQLRSVISGTSSDTISKIPVELREQAIPAVVDSLRKIFIPSYVAAAVALVTAVFLKRHRAFHAQRGS